MKPCRKQEQDRRRAGPPPRGAVPSQPPAVHRYVHPIRTVRPTSRPALEELLGETLEALSHQSKQLDEVLRRLEGGRSE